MWTDYIGPSLYLDGCFQHYVLCVAFHEIMLWWKLFIKFDLMLSLAAQFFCFAG